VTRTNPSSAGSDVAPVVQPPAALRDDSEIDHRREAASTRLLEAAIESSSSMGAGGGDVAIDIPDGRGGRGGRGASLPPAWVDFSEEASGDIARIKEKIKELAAAHAKALLPTFDEMGGADDHVVEMVTQDATRLFKRCEGRLQRLSAPGVCTTREDATIVKNVQRKLAVELQARSMEFRKMQRSYLARLKSQQDRGPGARGVDDVFGFVDAAGGSGSGSGGGGWGDESAQDQDMGFTDVQLQRVDRSEAMSFERDQEVMKILESVNDLSNVMKDLSVLIIDQGSILDRIDYNCEQVAMTVDDGRKQLIKAETHQKNSRMIICIYFLMVMCGIMTLVVVFQKM
jgi:syntaxin 16